MRHKIGVWGDSVLKGIIFDEAHGTYRLLTRNCVQMVGKALNIQIINKARFGSTINKGFIHLQRSLEKGLDCDLVLLEYGGNDCDFDWTAVAAKPSAPHQPRTPLPDFIQTLEAMVALLHKYGIKPALMSLPPISGSRYLDYIVSKGPDREQLLHFLGDAQQIYQFHEWYSLAITRLAAHLRCWYAPVRETFLAQGHCHHYLCLDGIHPNEVGHQLMQRVFTQLGEQALSGQQLGTGCDARPDRESVCTDAEKRYNKA